MATKEQQDEHAADYADQFNQPDQAPRQMSDEEAFGLTEPEGGAEPAGEAGAEPAGEPPAEAAAEAPAEASADAPGGEQPAGEAAVEAAPTPADAEQRLKSWEGRLKARQAELDAREAAMGDSSVNEEQASLPMGDEGGEGGEGYESDAVEKAEASTPGQILASDFGEDFVEQITALIQQICGECMGGVHGKVDQVIADLQNDRLQNHFSQIAASHADFMDVVESPEFAAWKAAQPDQDMLQKVIDGGSARQIIDMLTRFKQSRSTGGHDGDTGPGYDDALDAAEGVRSSGVSLPQEPAASDDFAKAWNEA